MSAKYLVAGMLVAAVAAPLPAQNVKAGIAAWQRADYSAAVAIWRPLAEGGDADAQFNLGQAYRLGRGVPLDLSAAKVWFERAARSGHVDAETTLGLLTFQNGDRAAGLKWLKQAADQGEPRALLVFGTALYNGDGVGQDRILGYAYVSRAAAQGLEPAQETLAQLDQLMPASERQRALALARSVPTGSPVPPRQKQIKVAIAKAPPAPRAAQVATAKPPSSPVRQQIQVTGGGWTIQLGAFSNRASAEALYRKLSGAVIGMQPHYVAVGSMTKLRVGSFNTRAQATAACQSLKGQACFPFPER